MAIRVSSKGYTNTKSTLNRIYQHKRKAIQSVCHWNVNKETSQQFRKQSTRMVKRGRSVSGFNLSVD